MHVISSGVTLLLIALFVTVAVLLLYGAYAFAGQPGGADSASGGRVVNLRLEVLWTSTAAALLLGVFLYAR